MQNLASKIMLLRDRG